MLCVPHLSPATGPVAEYSLPYSQWTTAEPTIPEMKVIVVDEQKRPVIPKAFEDNPVSHGYRL